MSLLGLDQQRVTTAVWLQFERGAGCGLTCSRRAGHDPLAHEAYARARLAAEQAATRSGTVRTGPLAVDFDLGRVLLDGTEPALTANSWSLLAHLAWRLDAVCSHRELTEAVWSADTAELWAHPLRPRNGAWHGLRVAMRRVRAPLGQAGALIETVFGRGYRLRSLEPW